MVARGDGSLAGLVSLDSLRSVVTESDAFLDAMVVGDAMTPLRALAPGDRLRAALAAFMETGLDTLPVIDPAEPGKVVGQLSQGQLIAAYQAELLRRRRDASTTMRMSVVGRSSVDSSLQ